MEGVSGLTDDTAATHAAQALLRVSSDALLDPQVLLEAVRASDGRVVDFVYRELNQATCDYLGLSREELLGRGVVETMPGIKDTLLPGYIRCVETGEPLILDDFAYDNEVLRDTRRYDLRASRATPTAIVVTWRDVSDRFLIAQRAAAAEAKFRQAMDNAAIGMCLITPDGRFEEVNDALCELFGYPADTLTQKTWQELTAPEFLEADLDKVNDVLAGRIDSYRMLKQYIHADGQLIWGDLAVSCVRDEHGAVVNFISQITDITDKVNAEERNRDLVQQLQRQRDLIAASEREYRLLIENVGDVVCHIRDDRVVWISPNAEEVLGAPAEYWLGRGVWEIVPPEDMQAHANRWQTLGDGGAIKGRVRVNSADAVTHWLALHAKPFHDDHGHRDGVSAVLRLIDDEVAAEQELEEARRQRARADARYRRLMESAAVAMCLVTPEGRFTEVNDAACRFFGLDAEALKQVSFADLTPQEYLDAEFKNFTAILEGRIDAYRMVKHFIRADGHTIWGDLAVSCVRDRGGRVTEIIGQIIDVTAEVEARQQIAEQNEQNRAMADQLQRQNDQIAIELNTLAAVAEHSPLAIAIFDKKMNYVFASNLWYQQYKITDLDVKGKSHYEIFPEVLDMPEWLDVHHRVMHGESLSSPADEFHRDDGTVQFVRWSMIPWLDRTSGEQIGAIMYSEDVTEQQNLFLEKTRLIQRLETENGVRKELEGRLRVQAEMDQLTGMFNRHYMTELLIRKFQRSEHDSTPFSIALIDVDHFKAVNDRYGHQVGDAVLEKVAEIIRIY